MNKTLKFWRMKNKSQRDEDYVLINKHEKSPLLYRTMKAHVKGTTLFNQFVKKNWKSLIVTFFMAFIIYDHFQMAIQLRLIKQNITSIANEVNYIKFNSSDDEISSIKDDISSMKDDVSSVQDDVSSAKSDISFIESRIGSIESDVSSIQMKVGY